LAASAQPLSAAATLVSGTVSGVGGNQSLKVTRHARGFAEQVLNPEGQGAGPGQGIPQLTVADLGRPACAQADQGGFYHFALLHATVGGDLQSGVPATRRWASVNAVSGVVTAHRAGTATISVTSGGITALVTVEVAG
jgi:hypothetical protein